MIGRLLILALGLVHVGDVAAGPDETGQVKGKVKLTGKSDPANVYVYIKGETLTRTVPKEPRVIKQKNKQFGPRVLAVVRGTTVNFPNEDRIMHNVYSRSPSNNFDLGHYKKGESKPVTFNKSGVIDIYCNIHPDMAATVLVVDNDFMTPIAADGTFAIPNLPPGKYEIVAWQPASPPTTKSIEVKASGTATVELLLAAPVPQGQHLDKDGNPHGRYK